MKPIEIGCRAIIVKALIPENIGKEVTVVGKGHLPPPAAPDYVPWEIHPSFEGHVLFAIKAVSTPFKGITQRMYSDGTSANLKERLDWDVPCFPGAWLMRIDDPGLKNTGDSVTDSFPGVKNEENEA